MGKTHLKRRLRTMFRMTFKLGMMEYGKHGEVGSIKQNLNQTPTTKVKSTRNLLHLQSHTDFAFSTIWMEIQMYQRKSCKLGTTSFISKLESPRFMGRVLGWWLSNVFSVLLYARSYRPHSADQLKQGFLASSFPFVWAVVSMACPGLWVASLLLGQVWPFFSLSLRNLSGITLCTLCAIFLRFCNIRTLPKKKPDQATTASTINRTFLCAS